MGRSCINDIRIKSLLWAEKLVKYALYNMQDYLTDEYEEMDFVFVAGILNFVKGISLILEVFLLFLVDEPCPRYKTMILISSMALGLGMGIITMSTLTKHSILKGMASVAHRRSVLYTGMILVAIGRAGYSVFIPLLIEPQKNKSDNNNSESGCGRKIMHKLRQLVFAAFCSIIPRLGAIALVVYTNKVYLNFGIPAIAIVVATLIFFSGWRKYDSGPDTRSRCSPLKNVCRVLVASAQKRMEPSSKLDHRDNLCAEGEDRFTDTRCLRCLHKAAIKLEQDNNWECSVAEVEEAKVIVRMIPMSMIFLVWGIVSSVGETYFMEQVGNSGEMVILCYAVAELSSRNLAQALLKKAEKIYAAPSIGITVAMALSVACCAVSAVVESWRRHYSKTHPLKSDDKECMYWFIFQFSLLGSLDGIFGKSIAAFYNQESPDSLKKYTDHFANGAAGVGFMCSLLSVYIVGKISQKGSSKKSWFQNELNGSRLNMYYWVLAGLSLVNLLVFVVVATCYKYKRPHPSPSPALG